MDPERYEDELELLVDDVEDTFDEDDWPDIVDLYRDVMVETFPGGPS